MEQPTWAGVRAIVLAVTALFLLPLQAHAERDWDFSVGVFGGKAFHSNESVKFSQGLLIGGGTFTDGTANGVNLNDAPTFGGKLTAWHLPRQYKWQPQIGLELDWTRFTAQSPPANRWCHRDHERSWNGAGKHHLLCAPRLQRQCIGRQSTIPLSYRSDI